MRRIPHLQANLFVLNIPQVFEGKPFLYTQDKVALETFVYNLWLNTPKQNVAMALAQTVGLWKEKKNK